MPDLLTVEEIARMCQVHEMTIRRHISEGRLKAVRVGKGVRVRKEDFDHYLQPLEVPPPGKKPSRPRLRPLTKDDPIFRLQGIVSVKEASDLSENKYSAFGDAYAPKP
jgi:excisionase family DNA binding protein